MATTLPAIKTPSPSPSGGRRSAAHAARAGSVSQSKSLSPVPAACDSLQWRRSMGVRRGEFGARSKLIDNPSRMPYQQRKDAGRKKRRRTGQGAADGPDAAAAAATGPQEGVDDEPLPSLGKASATQREDKLRSLLAAGIISQADYEKQSAGPPRSDQIARLPKK